MAWAKIGVVNEKWQPMAGVEVEAYNLDSPTTVIELQTTDRAGVALFTALTTDRFFFKPRATRASGQYGEASLSGIVRLQILASSGATCADAYVDPSGNFGTDATIQAAITRLATITGNVSIFVAGGTYTESLVISSSSAIYLLSGCGRKMTSWPLAGTPGADPVLSVVVNGGSGIALRITGSTGVVCEGIEFKNSAAGNPTVAPDNATASLRMDDCYVHNDNASGDAVASTVGPQQLYISHCTLKGAHSIAMPTACTSLWVGFTWLLGRVNGQATSGLAELINCFQSASNATASIDLKFAIARILGCTIAQNSTGDAVNCNTVGIMEVSNCDFTGTGSAVNGIKVNASAVANLSNNSIFTFTNGVNINATGKALIRGHLYTAVTNWVVGTPAFVGAKAYNGAAQSIPNNAVTKIELKTEVYDPDAKFDNATNYDYTVPATGWYHVDGQLLFDPPVAAAGFASIFIHVNGTQAINGTNFVHVLLISSKVVVSGDLFLTVGDLVTLYGYQNSGAAITLAGAGATANFMDIHQLQQ